MHPQPEPVSVLAHLVKEEPKPTGLEIAILHIEEDNGGDLDTYPTNAFAKVGVHLGINGSDLPRLARDFQREYKSLRSLFKAEDYCMLDHTEEGADLYRENWRPLITRIRDATTCLLLVCPDNSTAWADRRRVVLNLTADENHAVGIYKEELTFINLLFTQHSKAPSSWAYRKWIFGRFIDQFSKPHGVIDTEHQWTELFERIKEEVRVCISVAEHFPKNYYSWTHRNFVSRLAYQTWSTNVLNAGTGASNSGSHLLFNFLEDEVNRIEPWLMNHVSDHSAAHYGAEVLGLLLTFGLRDDGYTGDTSLPAQEWGLSLIGNILASSRTAFEHFQFHEVIWIWRRLCGCLFLKIIDGKLRQGAVTKVSSSYSRAAAQEFTKNEVIDLTENFNKQLELSKSCFTEDEKRLARKHSAAYSLWIFRQIVLCQCKDVIGDLSEAQGHVHKLISAMHDDETIVHNIRVYLPALTKSL